MITKRALDVDAMCHLKTASEGRSSSFTGETAEESGRSGWLDCWHVSVKAKPFPAGSVNMPSSACCMPGHRPHPRSFYPV
jgi:hypothetical protein